METFFIMLRKVTVFILLAVPGFIMVKNGVLEGKRSKVLSTLLSYVGMPFLIVSSMLNITFTKELILSMIFTAVVGTLFIFLTYYLSGFLTKNCKDEKKRGMMRFCMIFANNGFLGIPLAEMVFGATSPMLTYLIILNILNNMMIFALGSGLVAEDKKAIDKKKAFFNPVLFGFIAGLVLNVLKVSSYAPEVKAYSDYFRNLVTPVSMFVLGMKMAGVDMKKLFSDKRMYFVSAVRLVIFPIITMALLFACRLVFNVDEPMIMGFFIAFAVPTAGMSAVLADQYNGDSEGSAVYTLGTTILSVVALPILYWLLCMLV